MKRAIVAPPALSPAALSELKAWLGITTTREDAELTALLGAALDLCEGFIGAMPLQSGCEEMLAASGEWQMLGTRPVQTISGISAIALDGTRTALAASAYEVDLDADGGGLVRLLGPLVQKRIVVRFSAGLASDWAALPEALSQGILRLAAAQHRVRDSEKPGGFPPAAVAALWRPWRRMRLA
jgi:uncharacterized phiE125 gp8 family phage protein